MIYENYTGFQPICTKMNSKWINFTDHTTLEAWPNTIRDVAKHH